MGVPVLQTFVEGGHLEGVAESVELLQIARNVQGKGKVIKGKPSGKKLCLVLDAECCLDRLYGGFFSDWTCGGQWNRMMQYLHQLIRSCQKGNIELTIAFNGALEIQRIAEWSRLQEQNKSNVRLVLRHIQNKGTPPPKVWWVPPICLTTALRLALRHLNVSMICSMDDHHQEVLAYCRENNLHGIIGDDAEYLVFDPPRYFSASQLKLTFKGNIETKEFLVANLAAGLELTTQGLCILTALLGNYLLTEELLRPIYTKLKIDSTKEPAETVKGLAAFTKDLEQTDNLEALSVEIFGSEKNDKAVKRRQAFIESVQYYLNGTKDGFLKYKPRKENNKKPGGSKNSDKKIEGGSSVSEDGENWISTKFASESVENEAGSLEAYTQLSDPQQRDSARFHLNEKEDSSTLPEVNGTHAALNGSTSSPLVNDETEEKGDGKKKSRLSPEVLRTACERHQKGLMSPYVYQILTQGELKLPVVMEDDHQRELPSVHSMYRSVRQSVYAILFNVHHQLYLANKEQAADEEKVSAELPTVKEWHYPYTEPEIIRAEPISWPVPTIQRLWFGTNIEDMRRRLRAYLTCMKSDSPLMVSSAYVPQHLLVMASVLRYLMQAKPPVLRQLELDAFIVTAFSPDLLNSDYTQDLQLQMVTSRGVQLATLFMQGVEMALLANDACGAPIPYLMCSPWLYFDGKLFHYILAKTEYVKSLQELCNHRMDTLVKVERMRHAITENLHVQYARRGVPHLAGLPFGGTPAMPPAGYNPALDRRVPLRGPPRRIVSPRGGQLEVAGVVVCSWGANYSLARERLNHPQVGMGGGRDFGRGVQDRAGFIAQPRLPLNKRRPPPGRRPKGKKPIERKRESRGRGITDANTNLPSTPGNGAASSEDASSEGSPEQFEDAQH